jgi:two-component system, cell cycle response regulator
MTARILIVDDVVPNLKLLKARLMAEYFDVVTATNGMEALAICGRGDCDVVLLDVMMPEIDGLEVCRRLKEDPVTLHIPVVMVTALDQPSDRLKGLEAGADDFLTKPLDEMALIARVRSLSRLKIVLEELRSRVLTLEQLGMETGLTAAMAEKGEGGRILLVDDRESSADRVLTALRGLHTVEIEKDPQAALFRGVESNYDLFIISLGLQDHDALRLCSQLRSLERTRQLPLLCIAEVEDRTRVLRGLDLGVNDYLMRPIDRNELIARVRTQIRRKRYVDSLRDHVQASMELTVVDPLTGLNNRRYLETHLITLVGQAVEKVQPLCLMILDIDHFKAVNDTFGHDAGDQVLRGFAGRIKKVLRGIDLFCRLGGEEFVVVMPDTNIETAMKVAERVREAVGKDVFAIRPEGRAIPITVSIGLAEHGHDIDADELIRRADRALYKSKGSGRNKVCADAA